jgi:hypothetical protein
MSEENLGYDEKVLEFSAENWEGAYLTSRLVATFSTPFTIGFTGIAITQIMLETDRVEPAITNIAIGCSSLTALSTAFSFVAYHKAKNCWNNLKERRNADRQQSGPTII